LAKTMNIKIWEAELDRIDDFYSPIQVSSYMAGFQAGWEAACLKIESEEAGKSSGEVSAEDWKKELENLNERLNGYEDMIKKTIQTATALLKK